MTRRRAVAILRHWKNYDDETLAEAEQVIEQSREPWKAVLRKAVFLLSILIGAGVGLLGVQHFLIYMHM